MDNEKMLAVLTELLEEQRETSRSQAETTRAIQQLKVEIERVEETLKNRSPAIPAIDTTPIQQSVDRALAEIKIGLDMLRQKPQPSNIRIFMESDAKKWAVYLFVAVIFLTYLYLFAMHKASE